MSPHNKPSPGLMALGIVTIVAGVLFLSMIGCGAASLLLLPLMASVPGVGEAMAPTQMMMEDPVLYANAIAGFTVPTLLYGTAIAAGAGLIKRRGWGRKLALGFAGAHLVWSTCSTIFNLVVVRPRTAELMVGLPGAEISTGLGVQLSAALFGFVAYNALPVALLIVLNRPSFRAQFESQA